MITLASVSVDEIEKYSKYRSIYTETPVVKKDGKLGRSKKNFLYLDVVVDNVESLKTAISSADTNGVFRTLTYTGEFNEELLNIKIPEELHGRIFLKDITETFEGVVNYISADFAENLKDLYDKVKVNPNIRYYSESKEFIETPSIPFGRFTNYKGVNILGEDFTTIVRQGGKDDVFSEMLLEDALELFGESLIYKGVSQKRSKSSIKIRKQSTKITKNRSKKKSKKVQKQETFVSLFGSSEVPF